MLFPIIWMNLQGIMLSEIYQRKILYSITYVWNLKKTELIEKWLPGGRGNEDMLVRGYKLPVIRGISSGDLMYNMVTVVDNTVLHN